MISETDKLFESLTYFFKLLTKLFKYFFLREYLELVIFVSEIEVSFKKLFHNSTAQET